LQLTGAMEQTRWLLAQQSGAAIPLPLLLLMVFWLSVLLTDVDQAIAKLRIAIDEDNPVSSQCAVVLPFVIDTLRRDLGETHRRTRAAGNYLSTSGAALRSYGTAARE
jgi:hypothetical protein